MSYIESDTGILVPRALDTPYQSVNPFNRLLKEWNPPSSDADEALLPSLDSLRDQCRDLDRNESIARGAVENIAGNVVGEGLWPQSKLDHDMLEISEAEAREFERRSENLFRLAGTTTSLIILVNRAFTNCWIRSFDPSSSMAMSLA